MNPDKVPTDVWNYISTYLLEAPDLVSLCKSNNRIYDKICNKDTIWIYRLNLEFPNYQEYQLNLSPRKTYILLYQLNKLYPVLGYGSLDEIIRELEITREIIERNDYLWISVIGIENYIYGMGLTVYDSQEEAITEVIREFKDEYNRELNDCIENLIPTGEEEVVDDMTYCRDTMLSSIPHDISDESLYNTLLNGDSISYLVYPGTQNLRQTYSIIKLQIS